MLDTLRYLIVLLCFLLLGVLIGLKLGGGSGNENWLRADIRLGGERSSETVRLNISCPADATSESCRRLADFDWQAGAGQVCAQVYGGPEVAELHGRINGRRVERTVRRSDSCGQAVFDQLQAVLGVSRPESHCLPGLRCPDPMPLEPGSGGGQGGGSAETEPGERPDNIDPGLVPKDQQYDPNEIDPGLTPPRKRPHLDDLQVEPAS